MKTRAWILLLALPVSGCVVWPDDDRDGLRWPDDCNDRDPSVQGRTWYIDQDSDGYGDPDHLFTGCEQPAGYIEAAGDCDDDNPEIPALLGLDEDGDGWASEVCAGGTDCDDQDPNTYPGAPELCDQVANDCGASWSSDSGRATWIEQLEEGVVGSTCTVETGVEGADALTCTVQVCPVGVEPALAGGACCFCDATEQLNQASAAGGGLLRVQAPASSPVGVLSLCDGRWPVSIQITRDHTTPQTLVVHGAQGYWYQECQQALEEGYTVLTGSATHPVIAIADLGFSAGFTVRVHSLMVQGSSTCAEGPSATCTATPAVDRTGGGGVRAAHASRFEASTLCIRDVEGCAAEAETSGGALALDGVEEVELSTVMLLESCASEGGGLLLAGVGSASLTSVFIEDNTAWAAGGGALVRAGTESTTQVTATDLVLSRNTSQSGIGDGLVLWGSPNGDPRADTAAFAHLTRLTAQDHPGDALTLVGRVDHEAGFADVCSELTLQQTALLQHNGADLGSYDAESNTSTPIALSEDALASYQTTACAP